MGGALNCAPLLSIGHREFWGVLGRGPLAAREPERGAAAPRSVDCCMRAARRRLRVRRRAQRTRPRGIARTAASPVAARDPRALSRPHTLPTGAPASRHGIHMICPQVGPGVVCPGGGAAGASRVTVFSGWMGGPRPPGSNAASHGSESSRNSRPAGAWARLGLGIT